jgi:hypothetical protein
MKIVLEFPGETVEEALAKVSTFAAAWPKVSAAPIAEHIAEAVAERRSEALAQMPDEAVTETTSAPAADKPKRTRRTRAEMEAARSEIENHAAEAKAESENEAKEAAQSKAASVPSDPIPDFGAPATEITRDQIRQRLQGIIAARKEAGESPQAVIAYGYHLLQQFGIKEAAQLPTDRYPEFMAKSQSYLDGTAVTA